MSARTVGTRGISTPIKVVVLLVVLMVSLVGVSSAFGAQRGFIGWDDESPWEDYDFAEDDWADGSDLPTILVVLKPRNPARRVVLEYFDEAKQTWVVESTKLTRRGVARLDLNPYCEAEDGNTYWCDGEWTYRARVLPRGSVGGMSSDEVVFGFYPSGSDGSADNWDF